MHPSRTFYIYSASLGHVALWSGFRPFDFGAEVISKEVPIEHGVSKAGDLYICFRRSQAAESTRRGKFENCSQVPSNVLGHFFPNGES